MGFSPDGPIQGTYVDHTRRQNPRWSTSSALAHGPQVNPAISATGNPYHKTQVMLSYSRTEEVLNQALESALTAQAPPLRQGAMFPPRQGYDRSVMEITDVLRTNRFMGRDARFDYSGVTNTYRGVSRPGLGML